MCQRSSELAPFVKGNGKDGLAVRPSLPSLRHVGWDPTGPVLTHHSIWISDLCPHSPLGTEITMTLHRLVREEPRALPAVATHHTVGITAVSKVGEVFSFSCATRFIFKG